MTVERFQTLERESELLRKIAEQYASGSNEHLAIKHAAFALAFALAENSDKFAAFISACSSDLTEEQKSHIKSLGLSAETG